MHHISYQCPHCKMTMSGSVPVCQDLLLTLPSHPPEAMETPLKIVDTMIRRRGPHLTKQWNGRGKA